MNRKGKIFRWIGLLLSLPAALYAGTGFVFYAWLNAAEPGRWPAEKAALWAYSSLALAIMFFSVFIYCVVSLVREANRNFGVRGNAT
jgi:hypothetical protein